MKKVIIVICFLIIIFIVGCKKEEIPEEKLLIRSFEVTVNSEDMLLEVNNDNIKCDFVFDKEELNEEEHYYLYKAELSSINGYEFIENVTITFNNKNDITPTKITKEAKIIKIEFKKALEMPKKENIKIDSLDFAFSSETKELFISNDNVLAVVSDKEELSDDKVKKTITYEIKISLKEGYEFNPTLNLKWSKEETEEAKIISTEVSSDQIIVIIEKEIIELKSVEINLDTKKYEVSSDSSYYSAEIVKPLDYLVIVVKITIDINVSSELKFIVNEIEIDSSKYTIEKVDDKYVITYKIEDPNWTPYY